MSSLESRMKGGDAQHHDEEINNPPDSNSSSNANNLNKESEYVGDDAMYKDEGVIRIGLINIRGLPENNEHSKNEHTKAMIQAARFDHLGINEINKQWSAVPIDHRWHNRVKGRWQNKKSVISYNRKDINNDLYQPGGTISLAIDDLTCRAHKSGVDEFLGRWTWISYK